MCSYLFGLKYKDETHCNDWDLALISTAHQTIGKPYQSSHSSRSSAVSVQPDTSLHHGNRCSAAMVVPDQWFDD